MDLKTIDKYAYHIGYQIGNGDRILQERLLNGFFEGFNDVKYSAERKRYILLNLFKNLNPITKELLFKLKKCINESIL